MKIVLVAVVAVGLMCMSIAAQADVFNMGSGLTSLEKVRVCDAGNSANTRYEAYGSVAYEYNIGKYEVTAAQYTEFLNAKARADQYGLYNTSMTSTYGCNIQRSGSSGSYTYSALSAWANRPVNYVSFWDACRFANWLNNGQGDGDTETGTYALNGYNGSGGRDILRNAGSRWAVASEKEWYKAAYYKGGGTQSGYWEYATQTDTINTSMANYQMSVGRTTNVGSYSYSSAYGACDLAGNVTEWNETLFQEGYAYRGIRGGDFTGLAHVLPPSGRSYSNPLNEDLVIGFRVSEAVPAPEPSSLVALSGGLMSLVWLRRRVA